MRDISFINKAEEILERQYIKEIEYEEGVQSGIINEDISLDSLNFNKVENPVETISKVDDLQAYGLMLDEEGEIVSIPEDIQQEENVSNVLKENFSTVEDSNQEYTSAASSTYYYPGTKIAARRGDVIVTSNAFSKGIVGHVGIVTSTNYVEMKGQDWLGPSVDSLKNWFRRNGDATKVVRLTNSAIVTAAADWAAKRRYSGWSYKITGDANSLNPNYCSKFVAQAYNFGNGRALFRPSTINGVIPPYQFLNADAWPYTEEKVIYKRGMNFIGNM